MTTTYEVVKAWRKANPERVALQARRYQATHREHLQAYQKNWRDKNVERLRPIEAARARNRRASDPEGNRRRLRRFKEKREQLLEAHAGRPRASACELCREPGKTVYDHNHANGAFRGWLCDRCNRTLGQVKDDVSLLLTMATYLINGGPHGQTHNVTTESSLSVDIRPAGATKVSVV